MSSVILERETTIAPVRRPARLSAKRIALAILVIAALVGGAWYAHDWWVDGRYIEATDDAYVGGNITTISPHVAGFVADIAVQDNEHVRAGQLLVLLDRRDVQAAADRASAIVDARVAALANLKAQYALQQSVIQQSTADRSAKAARATFANADGARYATLALSTAGSRQNAERAEAADAEAVAALSGAKAGLAAAQQQVKVLDTEVSEADAAIAEARSELTAANLNLGYTQIRSPIDGYVGNRAAQVGAYVSEGTYLLAIIPAQGLWVDANFKEDQVARLRPGQAATVTADVAPDTVFHGHVVSLAPGTGAVFSIIPPENATGNFTKIVQRVPVRIALDDAGAVLDKLRPGLSTIAKVDTRTAP